ncbi:hypothetical protein PG989_013679 [Apiospora arundinis]
MATSNSASQASTSGTNKRPRSRSASESDEDRPAPALRAAKNPATGSEMVDAQVQVDHNLLERRLSFDPDGDLLLAVGEECPGATPATYKVDSRALSRASAIFRHMFHGAFAKSHRPEVGDWVVRLPEDSPFAISLMLAVCHLQFDFLPQAKLMDASYIQLIYDLVVVTEKYALTHCLRPWARSWTGKWLREKAESDNGKKPGRSNDAAYVPLQKSLYIMWELGHRPEFENTIAATRQKAVSRLLTPLLSLVPEMIADVPSDVPYHDYIIDDINCMLGATLRSTRKCRLWPLPSCDMYPDSVYQLTTSLKGVIRVLRSDPSRNSVLVGRMLDLQSHVNGILRDKLANNLEPVLSASQIQRLEARGKYTGLFRWPAAQ